MQITKEATIVPLFANAVTNLANRNSQYVGANADRAPANACTARQTINTGLRPKRSETMPNITVPVTHKAYSAVFIATQINLV